MKTLTKYEKAELVKIGEWKNEPPTTTSRILGTLTKPLVKAAEKVIPYSAIELTLNVANKVAGWASDTSDIIRDGQVSTIAELRTKNLQLSDQLANSVHNWAVGIAAVEGGSTGWIGLPGLAADIPLLITLALRTINKIGLCYGYETINEADHKFILGILNAASANSVKEKAVSLVYLAQVRHLLIQCTWKALNKKALSQALGKAGVIIGIKHFAKTLGINITKRAALKCIPGLGGLIGAAFNGEFIRSVGWTARRTFQERWLIENQRAALECEPTI